MSKIYPTRRALMSAINQLCHESGVETLTVFHSEEEGYVEKNDYSSHPALKENLTASFDGNEVTRTVSSWLDELCQAYCDNDEDCGGDEYWCVNTVFTFGEELDIEVNVTNYETVVHDYTFSHDEQIEEALEKFNKAGTVAGEEYV